MKWKILLAAALLAAGPTSLALAQVSTSADAIVAGRQAAYDLQGSIADSMKRAVDTGADVKPYADGAKAMAAWGRAIPGMFPAGTETAHNTKAQPAVWSDRAGFEKAAANFTDSADKLSAAAATGDKAAFADAFKATAGTCGACHRTFRVRSS